ncbi:MAG: hypothetical protein K9L59_20100, partial [Desulfobacterales bacterium]|nr:hypothetical protein [Desulfobacterales bacterium]
MPSAFAKKLRRDKKEKAPCAPLLPARRRNGRALQELDIFSAAAEKIRRPAGAEGKNDKRFFESVESMNGVNPTISIFGKQIGSFFNGGEAAANKYAKADLFRQLEGLIRPFLRCLGLR